jgi:hypothetical protein
LEQGKPFFQQRLELGVLRIGDQGVTQRSVDCLVIGDLVVDIGLVKGRAIQFCELITLGVSLLRQGQGANNNKAVEAVENNWTTLGRGFQDY